MVLPADTEAPGAAHLPLPSPPLPSPPLDSLHLLECHRCGEPMYHYLGELVGDFPLFRVWEVSCGECGALVEACEELVTTIRFQTPPRGAGRRGRISGPEAEKKAERGNAGVIYCV